MWTMTLGGVVPNILKHIQLLINHEEMMKITQQLREPILFQKQEEVPDKIGGFKTRWKYAFSSWAMVESLFNKQQFGNEVAFAKEVVSANFYQFTVRYRWNINSKMRVIWRERKFDITKIIDTDRRKETNASDC